MASIETLPIGDTEDLETSRLIAQLALEDLERLDHQFGRDPIRAADIASQREHWEGFLRTIGEHLRAQPTENPEDVPENAPRVLAENNPTDNAVVFAGEDVPLELPQGGEQAPTRFFFTFGGPPSPPTEQPVAGPSRSTNAHVQVERDRCVACTDPIQGPHYKNTCNHLYCSNCITTLIEACMRDETLYPPRCCNQPFIIDEFRSMLNEDLQSRFTLKRREYDTPADRRVYCPTPTCSRFLGSSATTDRGVIRCKGCRTAICSLCWQVAHEVYPCPNDRETLAVREMARTQGWQTCHLCNAIVELNQGCFHITCRCRAEFCYLCGVRWKNCTCPQWDEGRIVYAAQERVQAEVGPRRQVNFALREERVRIAVQVLRNGVNCAEHIWNQFNGPSNCEMCQAHEPVYSYVCRNCGTRVCGRCRFNRVA